MSYRIIVDSCGELTEEMKKDGHFISVSLELDVDDYHVIDDATFRQAEFLEKVRRSKNCPKSSCPSPQKYVEAFEGEAEDIYIVTLSAELSGSYNSAVLARNLYMEEHDNKNIYIFNSCSASIGETLIALRVQELAEQGIAYEEVIVQTEKYIAEQNTYFILETLEILRKNGRLSNMKAVMASALNIKPIMGATPEGTICQLGQARGMGKALDHMVQEMLKRVQDSGKKTLAISHCNCPKRAELLKEKIEKQASFRRIIILETAGVSTMYANNGGVIMSV